MTHRTDVIAATDVHFFYFVESRTIVQAVDCSSR